MFTQKEKLIILVYKSSHPKARDKGAEICAWIRARGYLAELVEANELGNPSAHETLCVIVLGGDGTILGVARKLVGKKIPIFGINFGRVGFLTATNPDEWKIPLKNALEAEDGWRNMQCLVLGWQIQSQGKLMREGTAINDLVLSRGVLARLVKINVAIDGFEMGLLRSDGLIVASPLGSSAYAVSAGGPILDPELEALSCVPVCPYLSSATPLVFPASSRIELSVEQGSTDCYLTIDGQEGYSMSSDERLICWGIPKGIQFLNKRKHYLHNLRSRSHLQNF